MTSSATNMWDRLSSEVRHDILSCLWRAPPAPSSRPAKYTDFHQADLASCMRTSKSFADSASVILYRHPHTPNIASLFKGLESPADPESNVISKAALLANMSALTMLDPFTVVTAPSGEDSPPVRAHFIHSAGAMDELLGIQTAVDALRSDSIEGQLFPNLATVVTLELEFPGQCEEVCFESAVPKHLSKAPQTAVEFDSDDDSGDSNSESESSRASSHARTSNASPGSGNDGGRRPDSSRAQVYSPDILNWSREEEVNDGQPESSRARQHRAGSQPGWHERIPSPPALRSDTLGTLDEVPLSLWAKAAELPEAIFRHRPIATWCSWPSRPTSGLFSLPTHGITVLEYPPSEFIQHHDYEDGSGWKKFALMANVPNTIFDYNRNDYSAEGGKEPYAAAAAESLKPLEWAHNLREALTARNMTHTTGVIEIRGNFDPVIYKMLQLAEDADHPVQIKHEERMQAVSEKLAQDTHEINSRILNFWEGRVLITTGTSRECGNCLVGDPKFIKADLKSERGNIVRERYPQSTQMQSEGLGQADLGMVGGQRQALGPVRRILIDEDLIARCEDERTREEFRSASTWYAPSLSISDEFSEDEL